MVQIKWHSLEDDIINYMNDYRVNKSTYQTDYVGSK